MKKSDIIEIKDVFSKTYYINKNQITAVYRDKKDVSTVIELSSGRKINVTDDIGTFVFLASG